MEVVVVGIGRARQAIDDWYHPSRIVIWVDNQQAADKMRHVYPNSVATALVGDVTS